MTDRPPAPPGIHDPKSSPPDIRTGSARRARGGFGSSLRGSAYTTWAGHLDQPTLIERLIVLFAVAYISLQTGGIAMALPLLLAVLRPRVPYLAAAGAGAITGVLLLVPGTDVIGGMDDPNAIGLVFAGFLGLVAVTAAFARAVEIPEEREPEWWIPVVVLGSATIAAWIFVLVFDLSQDGGSVAPSLLRLVTPGHPGLLAWPMAMAATLAFLPRSMARVALPAAAALVLVSLWMAAGGLRQAATTGENLAVRGQTHPVSSQIVPVTAFESKHIIDDGFRPSVVRLAPDGRSHALGALVSAKRGGIYEWRVFTPHRAGPFVTTACDIAMVSATHLLALRPAIGETGHTGFELVEVFESAADKPPIQVPLLVRPQLSFEAETGRWAVHGTEPPLTGRFRSRTEDGFVLDLFDGSTRIRVGPRTVFEGAASIDELERGDRIRVEESVPRLDGVAARVTRVVNSPDSPGQITSSILFRISGRVGSRVPSTTRLAIEAAGPVTWTPLDDSHALAQVSTSETARAVEPIDPAQWLDDGFQPEFELLAVSRHGSESIAIFTLAVVCKTVGFDDGAAICTASDDRSINLWRVAVMAEGIALESLISFRAPFVTPVAVDREMSILAGPLVSPIVAFHDPPSVGHLPLPGHALPHSIVRTGPGEFAVFTDDIGRVGIAVFQVEAAPR